MLLLKGAVTFVLPTSAGLCRYCCLMVNQVNWIFIGIWFDLVSPIWRSKDLGPLAQALDLQVSIALDSADFALITACAAPTGGPYPYYLRKGIINRVDHYHYRKPIAIETGQPIANLTPSEVKAHSLLYFQAMSIVHKAILARTSCYQHEYDETKGMHTPPSELLTDAGAKAFLVPRDN